MPENENEQDSSQKSTDEMTETEIDETLADTFPASDPPSWTLGTDHQAESQADEKGLTERDSQQVSRSARRK